MGGALRIATIKGIDIKVHWSFIFILAYGAWAWAGLAAAGQPRDPSAPLRGGMYGVLVMLVLFGFVVLHELGHGLAARYYGVKVLDITLLPLGGVARMEEIPEDPGQELVIAMAGPAVNLLLTILLFPVLLLLLIAGDYSARELLQATSQITPLGFLVYLLSTNVLLALFNLLPALPMDGGRALRAVLAALLGHRRATRIAVSVGQGLAVLMGIAGLVMGNAFLVLIAVFVFFGAGQEAQASTLRASLRSIRVGEAYDPQAPLLGPAQPIALVADIMQHSSKQALAVLVGSQVAGVVTAQEVLEALRTGQAGQPVSLIMRRDAPQVTPEITLYEAQRLMAAASSPAALIFEERRFLGLISVADIDRAHRFRSAAQRGQARRPGREDEWGGQGRAEVPDRP